MTLVYGAATEDIGFLVADTLISFDSERNGRTGLFNGSNHILKIQILNASVAVAFSGDIETGLDLINKLNTELYQNRDIEIPETLLQIYKTHTETVNSHIYDCEFLILQIIQNQKKLAKVTQKKLIYCERAYIGDSVEYSKMMQLRQPVQMPQMQLIQQPDGFFREAPLVISKGEFEFAEISDAMQLLTYQLKSRTVGAVCGCVTRVVDARHSGEFEYLQSIESRVSLEEGRTGYSYLTANSGVRGIGIYYRSGKMGFIFIVGDTQPCHKENAETLTQFIKLTHAKYGLNFMGGSWNDE